MRVYAVADIHGKHDRFERIRQNLADLKADILILAGDITNFIKPENILSRLDALPVPVLAIRGNSDLRSVDQLLTVFPNCIPMHAVCTRIGSTPFVGIGGTLPIPFRSRICLHEHSSLKKVGPLVNTHTVLVTHAPPYGCRDLVMGRYHAGSKGLLNLIKKRQPQIMICGHIHEDNGVSTVGKTRVVNCAFSRTSSGALIEFKDGNFAGLKMI